MEARLIAQESDEEFGDLTSYMIVGDNLDKNFHPRHMTLDKQVRSEHMFHCFGVKNRVVSDHALSDNTPACQLEDLGPGDFLPSVDDSLQLRENYISLMCRIALEKFPFFKKCFGDAVPQHILHEHTQEMKAKSEVVSACMQASNR